MLVDDLITAVRRCRPCGRDLPLTEFSKSTRNGYQSACKACRAAKFKEWKARGCTKKLQVVPDTKLCTGCGKDLPLSAYRAQKQGRYGKAAKCGNCYMRWHRERQSRPEVRQQQRASARAYSATLKGRYGLMRDRSKLKGYTDIMSLAEYRIAVTGRSCVYCERPLPEKGVGLDRLDNNTGYTAENVVPCCGVCNTARSDNFSHEEFIEIAAAIRSVLARREAR